MSEVSSFKRGTSFTIKSAQGGSVPVVANSPKPIAWHDVSNREGDFIVVARSGANAGAVSFWSGPTFVTDAFSIHPVTSEMHPRFAFYLLQSMQRNLRELKAGSGVPHVRVKDVESHLVPVPPLADQDRIVGLLENFDALVNDFTSGLPAEIEARRKQYEYYRDELLTFEEASA